MWNIQGRKHLKTFLLKHPEGRQVLTEIMQEVGMSRSLIAISHSDRVDIYGYGPDSIRQYNAIAAHSPEAEILAEQIVELECRKPLFPYATFGKFGKIGTVTQRHVTAAEYAWNSAMGENLELLKTAGGSNGKTS